MTSLKCLKFLDKKVGAINFQRIESQPLEVSLDKRCRLGIESQATTLVHQVIEGFLNLDLPEIGIEPKFS